MKKIQFALLCAATLAMIACKPTGNEPDGPVVDDPNTDDPNTEEPGEYVSPISVSDNSLADWEGLENVASFTLPEGASYDGLKSVKVYADEMYINIAIEVNPETVTDLDWTPFHAYINCDNSAETGGYGDQFTDPDADVCLETAIYASGVANSWNPGVFKWWGPVGGNGWAWTEHWEEEGYYTDGDGLNWGAIVAEGALPIGASQAIGNIHEIQLMWEMIPAPNGWNEEGFTIGFDIQQNWSSVGILPIAADDENGVVYANKLAVKFNK